MGDRVGLRVGLSYGVLPVVAEGSASAALYFRRPHLHLLLQSDLARCLGESGLCCVKHNRERERGINQYTWSSRHTHSVSSYVRC